MVLMSTDELVAKAKQNAEAVKQLVAANPQVAFTSAPVTPSQQGGGGAAPPAASGSK